MATRWADGGVVTTSSSVLWADGRAWGGGAFEYVVSGAPFVAVLKRWNGVAWVPACLKRYNGSEWVLATLRVYKDGSWGLVNTSGS